MAGSRRTDHSRVDRRSLSDRAAHVGHPESPLPVVGEIALASPQVRHRRDGLRFRVEQRKGVERLHHVGHRDVGQPAASRDERLRLAGGQIQLDRVVVRPDIGEFCRREPDHCPIPSASIFVGIGNENPVAGSVGVDQMQRTAMVAVRRSAGQWQAQVGNLLAVRRNVRTLLVAIFFERRELFQSGAVEL